MSAAWSDAARRELGRATRDRAIATLGALAKELPAITTLKDVAWEARVHVDVRAVGSALLCMHRQEEDEPYVETAANARRRVGLEALALLAEPAGPLTPPTPLHAVRAAVARIAADPDDRLGQWLEGLGPGGRSAVVREATAYVHAARTQLAWPLAGGFRGRSDRWEFCLPNRAVFLRARIEAASAPPGRPDAHLLLLGTASDPVDVRVLAYVALVATIVHRCPPVSITHRALPTQRRTRLTVDEAVLDEGLNAAATGLAAEVARRIGPPAPSTSGPWCIRCCRRSTCEPGVAWQAGPGRRNGGLPPIDGTGWGEPLPVG